MSYRPILCLDFDGVLHGYQSGWKGARNIPDAPIPGALRFLVGALDHFSVHILSSRSHQWGGRRAMKVWLRNWLIAYAGSDFSDTPEWWSNRIARTAFADPWKDEVAWAADKVVDEIKWPLFKPPATVTIDDRALQFTGSWPEHETLLRFKPWKCPAPLPPPPTEGGER